VKAQALADQAWFSANKERYQVIFVSMTFFARTNIKGVQMKFVGHGVN
jgi:hypothetical protein